MTTQTAHPIVLFDGECNFCNASINFILKHEADQSLRFAPSQSSYGQTALAEHGINGRPGSIVLIEDGQLYSKSTASLRLAKHLKAPWSWLALLAVIPRPIRDGVYGWVAANRHRFNRGGQQCRVPTAELKERFVG